MPKTRTQIQFTWANDAMNFLVPAAHPPRTDNRFYDDDGFTNDFALRTTMARGDLRWGIHARFRMITERGGGRLRSDEDSVGAWVQSVLVRRHWETRPFAGLGLVATGPLGGAGLQDRFHRTFRNGRTLDGSLKGQLQDRYEGGIEVGAQLALGCEQSLELAPGTKLLGGAMIAASGGVGASSGQVSLAFERLRPLGDAKLRSTAGLSIRHVRSEEKRLTFKGGYPEGKSFVEPFADLSYERRRFAMGFRLILNVEGTGAHQGAVSLGYLLGE